jgi:hypothetical protein
VDFFFDSFRLSILGRACGDRLIEILNPHNFHTDLLNTGRASRQVRYRACCGFRRGGLPVGIDFDAPARRCAPSLPVNCQDFRRDGPLPIAGHAGHLRSALHTLANSRNV